MTETHTTPDTEPDSTPPDGVDAFETVIDARRPIRAGGGQCSLIVRGVIAGRGNVHVLHHGVEYTGVVLDSAQVDTLISALSDARRAAGIES